MARAQRRTVPLGRSAEIPLIRVRSSWDDVLRGRDRSAIEEVLPSFLMSRRWFGGKARAIRDVEIEEAVPVGRATFFLILARVAYAKGERDTYVITLGFATGERATHLLDHESDRVLARLRVQAVDGALHEAFEERAFSHALLQVIARGRVLHGLHGDAVGVPARGFRRLHGPGTLEPVPLGAEQSNSSLVFGDRLILKLFRRLEPGPNPEVEIGRFLTEKAGFRHSPEVAGVLEYRARRGRASALAVVQRRVPSQGDAWRFTLDSVERYFERAVARPADLRTPPPPAGGTLLDRARAEVSAETQEAIGSYLADARLLGRRTAELHLALAAGKDDPAFAPERFTPSYQRSLEQSMRTLAETSFSLLERRLGAVPEAVREPALELLARQGEVRQRFAAIFDRKIRALRTRVHGDYHLGQVLRSGADWVIIDFEGEPALPLAVRRTKHCPLRDAAGMVRSFHYAAHHGLMGLVSRGAVRPEERSRLEAWAQHWYAWVAAAFLRGYLDAAAGTALLPEDDRELEALLAAHLLEKALYELGYELNNRPEWAFLPLAGIRQLLETSR